MVVLYPPSYLGLRSTSTWLSRYYVLSSKISGSPPGPWTDQQVVRKKAEETWITRNVWGDPQVRLRISPKGSMEGRRYHKTMPQDPMNTEGLLLTY